MAGLRPGCLPRAAATAAPVPAPPPAPLIERRSSSKTQKTGLAGKAVCRDQCPTSNAGAGRPAAGLNAKREGRQRRPSSKLASLATSDDDGRRRGSPIVRNDDAGPRQGTAPKLSRSAQDARNRVRTGKGAARPRKRLYELPTPFSPPTCSRPGAGRGRPRSVSVGFVKFPVVACVL